MRKRQEKSDEELAKSLIEGDEAAFAEIYERYWKTLLAIAYKHTKDKAAAENIVQDVFIALWDRRKAIQIRSISTYLATAVKFATFKSLYRARRHAEIEQESLVGRDIQLDEEHIDALFLQEYLNGIVEELPDKCRLVFRYSREKYLSNAEIAQSLSISEKAVEANLTRALKILRLNLRKAGLFTAILWLFLG